MRALAQANVENQLPVLKHLDISRNNFPRLEDLFAFGSTWSKLEVLKTEENYGTGPNRFSSLNDQIQAGHLESLRLLGFTTEHRDAKWISTSMVARCQWKCLDTLQMYPSASNVLSPLVEVLKVDSERERQTRSFPRLNTVQVYTWPQKDETLDAQKLRALGVRVFFVSKN